MDGSGVAQRRDRTAPIPPLIWGRVEGEAERIAIVATGPSCTRQVVKTIARAADCGATVIAVKAAIYACPFAHAWVSIDPNDRSRAMMRKAQPGVAYYAAVPEDFGTASAEHIPHRAPAPRGPIYLHRDCGRGPSCATMGLSEDAGRLMTGNSTYGALGVAYHKRPRDGAPMRIAIFGLDGTQAPGLAKRRPGKLSHLPQLFASALPQLEACGIEIVNASPHSLVTCFPRRPPGEAVDWLIG